MLHAELEVACGRSTEVAAETWALAVEDRAELRARVKAFRLRPVRKPTTP
jgi:hypothetical protein